jgi:hypothetical protein
MCSGVPVDVELALGRAHGSVGESDFDVSWYSASNYRLPPGHDLPASLEGTWAGSPIVLEGAFQLGPGVLFDRGVVTGSVGPIAVRADVRHAAGSTTSKVLANGSWGETAFALLAETATRGSRKEGRVYKEGRVRGRVAERTFRVSTQSAPDSAQLSGSFEGPAALLLIVAFAVFKFTGALYSFAPGTPPDESPTAPERSVASRAGFTTGTVGGRALSPPPPAMPLAYLRLADGFEVVDDRSATEDLDPALAFALSEPMLDAAHRVASDVRRSTDLEWVLNVDLSVGPQPGVWFWQPGQPQPPRKVLDGSTTESVAASATVQLATMAQAEVSGVLADPWPRCGGHSHPAEPALLKERAVWKCPVDDSVTAVIGELASAV